MVREDSNLEHSLNRFWEVEAVEQSITTAEQQACEELPNKMGHNPIDTSSLSEEPDHSDPAKIQEGRKTIYCLPLSSLQGESINHNDNVDYTERRCQAF